MYCLHRVKKKKKHAHSINQQCHRDLRVLILCCLCSENGPKCVQELSGKDIKKCSNMSQTCSKHVPNMFQKCSNSVLKMFQNMFIKCSKDVPTMFQDCSKTCSTNVQQDFENNSKLVPKHVPTNVPNMFKHVLRNVQYLVMLIIYSTAVLDSML
jgi:hypothetical protein